MILDIQIYNAPFFDIEGDTRQQFDAAIDLTFSFQSKLMSEKEIYVSHFTTVENGRCLIINRAPFQKSSVPSPVRFEASIVKIVAWDWLQNQTDPFDNDSFDSSDGTIKLGFKITSYNLSIKDSSKEVSPSTVGDRLECLKTYPKTDPFYDPICQITPISIFYGK
jgi:hypothetical protein